MYLYLDTQDCRGFLIFNLVKFNMLSLITVLTDFLFKVVGWIIKLEKNIEMRKKDWKKKTVINLLLR